MIGGGTSFAAQGALPGDFLYPVKTEFNENIRAAFAVSADSEAKLQANLLEERIAEAVELQAAGKLTADTTQSVAANITLQTNIAMLASANSSVFVAKETKSQIQGALTSFLAITNLDSKLTADISASIMTSTLSTGEYDISSYKADTTARTSALAVIVEKNKSKLQSGEYINLNLKIVAASKLTADAALQADADARVTLDKAATLVGEVEAKLSTLGQVEIDPNTGIITDIDFSIDPMIIDRGNGSGNGIPTDPRAAKSGEAAGDVKIETGVRGSLNSEVIQTTVENSASASSSLHLGL